jgi:hypothetical protein
MLDGLPAVITVSMEHNHSLGTAEALYYTRPSRAVKQHFDEYFMGGMYVSEATRAHQDYLELSEATRAHQDYLELSEATRARQDYLELSEGISGKTFASSALNLKPRTVSFWYDQWRQKHLGPREGKSSCEVGKVTVLSEEWLINKAVYQMNAYYLWFIFLVLCHLILYWSWGRVVPSYVVSNLDFSSS